MEKENQLQNITLTPSMKVTDLSIKNPLKEGSFFCLLFILFGIFFRTLAFFFLFSCCFNQLLFFFLLFFYFGHKKTFPSFYLLIKLLLKYLERFFSVFFNSICHSTIYDFL